MDRWQDCRTLLLITLITAFCASVSYAQIPDAVTAAQAPVPGVGHGYIGMGAETVNPADGMVSFDLPIQTPAGRQLSFPFGIHYSGTEQFYLASTGNPGSFGWSFSPAPPYELNGWSYELPNYTAAAFVTNAGTFASATGNHYFNCDGSHNYVFRGLDGVQSIDGLANNWNDPTNPVPNFCGSLVTAGTTTGDNGARATLNGTLGNEVQPALTVVEPSGTVYQFPQGPDLVPCAAGCGPPVQPWGLLAQTITDRNGNQIKLSGPNNPITPMQAGSYIDTLGRKVVSWTGIGSSTGDQLSVAGLSGNIVVRWTTATITLPSQSTWVSGAPFANSCTENSSPGGTQIKVVGEIDLPNNTKYTFTYGGSGLTKITFPEGGYVRYVWGTYANSQATYQAWWDNNVQGYTGNAYCFATFATPAVTDRYVSYNGTTEVLHQHFVYAPPNWSTQGNGGSPYWTSKNTTVTSTDLLTGQSTVSNYTYGWINGPSNPVDHVGNATCGSQTSCTYANPGEWLISQVPVEQTILYQDGGSTLKTENKKWAGQYAMAAEQTILSNGVGTTKLLCYGTFGGLPIPGTVMDIYEYGFQTEGTYPGDPPSLSQGWPNGYSCPSSTGLNASALGPLQRHTHTAYHDFGAPGTYILDHPDNVIIYDGSGTQVAKTMYAYDAGTVSASGAATGLVSPPGLRGNPTSIQHLISGSTYATTSYTYFDTGQVASMIDPCNTTCSDMTGSNHTTSYSYADSYAAGTGTPPGQTNAYLTGVTFPNTGAAHVENFTWGYNNGRLMSSSDQNTQPTSYQYTDTLARLTQVSYPDGGQTTYAYNDSTYNSSLHTPSVTATKVINSNTNSVITTAMDGMGHIVRTLLTSDPNGTAYTDTTYDGFGRTHTVSNPYYTTSDATYGITTYTYDALGRTTSVQNPDGSTRSNSYTGRATLSSDEGNGTRSVKRISQADGLGRVTSLCEVTSTTLPVGSNPTPTACGLDIAGTGFKTTYSYDALDNLKSVTQGNLSGRSFAYDSLSRLTSATNPESGTITYSYDANGNLSGKTAPLPNQTNPATTVAIKHTYDVLNRVTSTYYNDGSTPSNYFSYDQSSIWGYTLANPIGRKTSASRTVAGQNSQYIYSYDPMGRIAFERRCVPMNCGGSPGSYLLAYTYDDAGNLTSATNGLGTTTTYGPYNGANELTSVTSSLSDQQHPGTLLTQVQYNALGRLTAANVAGVVYEQYQYNSRRWQFAYLACIVPINNCTSPQTLYTWSMQNTSYPNGLGFAPNGDILYAADSVNANWTYGYDDFNRLSTAVGTSGLGCSWDYDQFGNRWHQNTYNGSCTTPTFSFTGNNNRIDGYSYDAAGNLLNDGFHNYTYDAENRVIKVDGGNTATYVYDAEGNRIQKTTGGVSVDYLYDAGGHQITEVGSTGVWNRGEVYAAGRHLATYRNSFTYLNFSDWLGTERVRAISNGSKCETITSLPFGDNQAISGSCTDLSPMHFTGKERDTESGLDNFGARYDSSSLGRFMSPDSLNTLDLSHPQKLNRYAYANNNPLSNVDVGGHCTAPAVSGGQVGICVESYIRARFLPGIINHLALAQGDNRRPNPHGGTFRTQTLLSVDPSTHEVKIQGQPAAGKSCAIEGCYLGVNNSYLSKTTHDDKGNTYFTLTVYGENGYEANGKTGAPGGWIEMQFSFTVNSKGEVTVSNPETKGYPSASIYSYDSGGNAQDVWQQTESGDVNDLFGPRKPANSNQQSSHVQEEADRQCALGNPAACD